MYLSCYLPHAFSRHDWDIDVIAWASTDSIASLLIRPSVVSCTGADRALDVASPSSTGDDADEFLLELLEKQRLERQNLTLTAQPFKTFHLFAASILLSLKKSLLLWLTLFITFASSAIIAVSHDQHTWELSRYFSFGVWWIALGVASSIGFGYGYPTFVLYLGPHIVLFTSKSMSCGRVDLKSAPYDTILWNGKPSWLDKECREFGPPLFSTNPDSLVRVPVSRILPQVQLEALLWGIGTALGELPPYFISKAARTSGGKVDVLGEHDTDSSVDGILSSYINQLKQWLFGHSNQLNFFTILSLASIPNPLFDLAGMVCGDSGVPFWKFFLATMVGKAVIKIHLQTAFIILLWNNQLFEFFESELIARIPGFSRLLPHIISKLHFFVDNYDQTSPREPSALKGKLWRPSASLIWNSVLWVVLLNFTSKTVTLIARKQLEEQQKMELTKLKLMASRKGDQAN